MTVDDDRELRALERLDTTSPPPAAAPITPATLRRRLRVRRARTAAAATALLFCATWLTGAALAETTLDRRADDEPPTRSLARDLAALDRRVDALLAELAPVPDAGPQGRAELRLQLARARADALPGGPLTAPDPVTNRDRVR